MTIARSVHEALKPAIDLLYPPRCPLCGDAIAEQKGLCAVCWSELVIPTDPSCASCQRPFRDGTFDSGEGAAQCAPCLAQPPRHDGIAAGTIYNDASRKLVLAFKHGRRIALGNMLANLMVARLPELDGEWIVVPVPLHYSRLWMRGFNQAALLAAQIAKHAKQPLIVDGLRRTKRTNALGGLGRKDRERMLAGAISVSLRHVAKLEGRNIVLVDDVLTSGATSEACVKALKKAGANKVIVSCFARVMNEAL